MPPRKTPRLSSMAGMLDTVWDEDGSGSALSNFTEEDNSTLTCAALDLQGPIELPYSSALTITLRVIQSVYYCVIIIGGLFLNTLLIVLVAKYKKLQTLSFLVSLQVAVLDWLLSISIFTGLCTNIANKWLFGKYGCAITGLIFGSASLARTFLMCAFVIDRYLAIVWPYFYPKHKFKVTVSLSIASWVFAVLVGIGMLPGLLDCYIFRPTVKVCSGSSLCSYSCFIYIRIYTAITIPATILPVILYGFLYYKARKIQKELASNAAAANANHRKEWKATITYSLLFLTLIAVVLPTIVTSLIIAAIFPDGDRPPWAYTLLVVTSSLILLLTITDPIVIMRDKDVKDVLSKIKNAVSCKKKVNTATRNVPPQNALRTTAF